MSQDFQKGVCAHPNCLFSKDPVEGHEQVKEVMERLDQAKIDFVQMLVKGTRSDAYYSTSLIPMQVYERWDPFQETIEQAHKRGIEVHAFICPFPEGGDEIGPTLQQHPDWAMVSNKGKRIGWACPSRPEVKERALEIISELLENYDLDVIHLDYIRTPDFVSGEWISACYCDYCRSQFKQEYGTDPMDLGERGELVQKWDNWRREQISDFVRLVHERVREAGKKLIAYCWDLSSPYTVFQDWPGWVRRGYVDFINPTGYVYTPGEFRKLCQQARVVVNHRVPTYISIGVETSHGRLHSAQEVIGQINIAKETGLEGVIFFHLKATLPFLPEIARSAF